MKTTELFNAYFWDCDNCGNENFERAIRPEIDEDIMEALAATHNVGDKEPHFLVSIPYQVECKSCKESYKTTIGD
jgi:hypothetical protein